MKKIILLSIMLTATTITAFTQAKQESIKILIKLMNTDSMMEKTFDAITPTMLAQARTVQQDSAQLAANTQHIKSVIVACKATFNKVIYDEIALVYDKFYTESEIKDLIAFYSTPTGRKTIEKMPEIQQEIMSLITKKIMPEIQEKISLITLNEQFKKNKTAVN
ncbi:MAG: DUF2059 domain-containing protein [Paludibacter sp.]|nr:DUF2059 domain-containing protein [Paludibacter sp.]